MVKHISPQDKERIAAAVTKAEQQTSAEIAIILVHKSDAYKSFVLLYGLLLGSLVALGLWWKGLVTDFPMLLTVQLGIIALLMLLPFLQTLCIPFIPKHILHHRAAKHAYEQFQHLSNRVPTTTPVVLLFISLAERYVHILHSRAIRDAVPEQTWADLVRDFATLVKEQSLANAITATLENTASVLAPHFPDKGEKNVLDNDIIIKKK